MLRLYGKKHVYMLGVNAGEFPAAVSDLTYFSDRDKATLSSLGLAIEPELEIKNAREMFIFSRVFSYASESVTLLYTCCNTQFKAIERASVIDRIVKLTGGTVTPISIASLPTGSRIWTPEAALRVTREREPIEYDGIREALIASGYGDKLRISEGDITNSRAQLGSDVCSELYGDRMSMSSTRLDSYVGCPFGYFCKYTLSLSEESRAEFDASSIGTFIHSILESFFRGLEERGESPDSLSHGERVKLTEDAAKKYIASLGENVTESSALTRIKIKRLCRAAMPVVDGLCEEFSQSKFKPRFFELAIRRGEDTPTPVRITASDGTEVTVYGFIDRVDTYKSGNNVYVRVVDYKTGQKDFSPEDMEKGENLQMFLYLESILKSENRTFLEKIGVGDDDRLVPAGVIYVKTSVSDVRVDKPDDAMAEQAVMAAQEREGMVIDDEEAISAMGLPYTPLYSARTPDKIPDSRRKYMYDEKGFKNIMETVEGCVGTVAERIRKGDVSPMPKDTGSGASYCTYCKFKPICRKAIIK
jgi:ATP-dependent helicase/nuclease subunit B